MSFQRRSATEEKENMEDFTTDFESIKISALKKVALIPMADIKHVTIGPLSTANINDTNDKLENIQDEKNSCNLKKQKSNSPNHNTVLTPSGVSFSVMKILQEIKRQKVEEVNKKVDGIRRRMDEEISSIREKNEKDLIAAEKEYERKHSEDMKRVTAEGARIAEEERIKRQQKQELMAQFIEEEKEKNKIELEEIRKFMIEKEEIKRDILAHRDHFLEKYYGILTLSSICKDKCAWNKVFAMFEFRFRGMYQHIESITEKAKVII